MLLHASAPSRPIRIKCQNLSYPFCLSVLQLGVSLGVALSARPFLDKTNSHTSSRLRLTLWCRWPSLTPFVSLPASDVAICLFLYYQSWPAPLQLLPPSQPHNGPLRQTTHTHTHTQTHIYTQHDTYAGRLSCLDMLVVISITSHIVRSAASSPPNEA